jgi:hypothetical protein
MDFKPRMHGFLYVRPSGSTHTAWISLCPTFGFSATTACLSTDAPISPLLLGVRPVRRASSEFRVLTRFCWESPNTRGGLRRTFAETLEGEVGMRLGSGIRRSGYGFFPFHLGFLEVGQYVRGVPSDAREGVVGRE